MQIINRLIELILYFFQSPKKYAKRQGVQFGDNCRIASKNLGSEPYLISLGNHVHITKGVNFVTHDGAVWVYREEIKDFDVFGKIHIDDNTYIGNNVTILPGVTIGKNCIVGTSSVVTKSIPDGIIVAGNPARFILRTDEYKEKMLLKNAKTKLVDSKTKKAILKSTTFDKFIVKKELKID